MRRTQILTIAIAILLLAACGGREAQLEPPRPTSTPAPTFTSTPAGAAVAAAGAQNVQPTPQQPTATPVPPTVTPTPQPLAVVGSQMNVRAGPGVNYNIVGAAAPGDQFPITGKNPGLGDWWEIQYTENLRAWLYGPLVNASNAGQVAIAQFIPAPPPPTATPVPPPTPVPAPTAPQYKWFVGNPGQCYRNDRAVILKGFVVDRAGGKRNDMCVHMSIFGPRQTLCTGCPPGMGRDQGFWEFTPFGVANEGEPLSSISDVKFPLTVEIFMVNCPETLRPDKAARWSQDNNFGDLTPISEKWVKTLPHSSQCNNIDFQER